MSISDFQRYRALVAFTFAGLAVVAQAAPSVSRLTPASELFTSGRSAPVIARFLPVATLRSASHAASG